jgi:hypothetical protein
MKFPRTSLNSPPVILTFEDPWKNDMGGIIVCGTNSTGCGLNEHLNKRRGDQDIDSLETVGIDIMV